MSHYDEEYPTPEEIEALLAERALSDQRSPETIELDAHAENYDRDWQTAVFMHDWFCNRCTGHDHLGARCKKRHGHTGKHDATFNGYLMFVYSEEKVSALVYTDSPLLRMVSR